MKKYIEDIQEENIHVIAYNNKFCLGYNNKTKRAFYAYVISEGYFSADLLSHTNDSYQKWANPLIEKLHFKVETAETENDYFETITKL